MLLFSGPDWFSVEKGRKGQMSAAILNMDTNRILNTPLEDLADYFEGEYQIEVPVLITDEASADQQEKDIDVSGDRDRYWGARGPHLVRGTEVTVRVPFSGDQGLFKVRPTSFTLEALYASVEGNEIVIRTSDVNPDAARIKAFVDRQLQAIEGYLATLRKNAAPLNKSLRTIALEQLTARKEKLLKDQNLVSELGFKLRDRSGMPKTYVAPEVKRKMKPTLPPSRSGNFKPEPAISTEDYEHILTVIQNMAIVMEQSPSAFESINEESLRSHFLVQLNGQYEGQATGETFNFGGKTDILLRVDGKNIFIAECKYWGGPKKLSETVDQLLSYSSWRDTKAAILIFNRRKNFSKVLQAIPPTIESHESYKRTESVSGETSFRFILGNIDDRAREIILTVLAFDIPELSNE